MPYQRIFLEQLSTPDIRLNFVRWKIVNLFNDKELPPLIYIIESQPGQEFLLGRGLSTRRKFEFIQQIAQILFEAIKNELKIFSSISQFIILRGAYPFDLQTASKGILPNKTLTTHFIRLRRNLNEDKLWKIEPILMLNNDSDWESQVWLIPDTAIASGSTISCLLREGFKHYKPEKVFVFTAVGALEGIKKIYKTCREYGVEFMPIFSQCIFAVSSEGVLPNLPLTDLSIEHERTISSENFYQKAHIVYQGKKMCAVGDIGKSIGSQKEYEEYLMDTLYEMQILGIDPNQREWQWVKALWSNEIFRCSIKKFNPQVYTYLQIALRDK